MAPFCPPGQQEPELPRVNAIGPEPEVDYPPFDIFRWLSTEAQRAFLRASRRRRFPDGSRIYSQSEPGGEIYRIVSGSVRMSILCQDGREALYLVLVAGDCFGICSLLDGSPRHHTTRASGDVEVQVLRRDACERLRFQHASFAAGLIGLMMRHVRLLSEYLASATFDPLSRRVALRLLRARKYRARSGDRVRLTVRISQSEIALMVRASRQAVSKVLQKYQEEGLISIEYGRIHIRDIERLRSAV